ncbi:luciferase family protein [Planctomicrobium sp. SH661]|uniref:luciferase domain-containing protein n=1 Tax=Planctomicrobium sp. SH661 TaxID=3448124 RepID=UPI003F5BB13D
MELFGARDRIITEALGWDGVSIGRDRSEWTELQLGRRVFAQLHRNAAIDVLLPKGVRVELVMAGEAEPHPVLPASGWVTIYLHQPSDEERALKVVKRAYDVMREQSPGALRRFRFQI